MNYTFGDIVIVEKEYVGVVVKSWLSKPEKTHEVYVRSFNVIKTYLESDLQRYLVRHKELSEEEKQYQFNAMNDL